MRSHPLDVQLIYPTVLMHPDQSTYLEDTESRQALPRARKSELEHYRSCGRYFDIRSEWQLWKMHFLTNGREQNRLMPTSQL